MSSEDDLQAQLIAEQIRHILDVQQVHIDGLSKDAGRLEVIARDHEQRLRDVTAGITQFRSMPGVLSLMALVISIIAGLRSFFGG